MKLSKLALGVTLAAVLSAPVWAQEEAAEIDLSQDSADVAVNSQFGQWVVSCQAVTVSSNVCRLVQEQVLRESNVLVARFIVQPGGSIRDKEVIEACDKYGIAMAFTGMRHFRH